MKCIFVGVFNPKSTNYSQARSLEVAGCEVIRYPYRDVAINKGLERRDDLLIDFIKNKKVDFVLFSKCNTVNIRVIKEINSCTKTILWYMDSMNSNWNKELIEKIKYCDITICALKIPYEKAWQYSKEVHFLHEGFDELVDKSMFDGSWVRDTLFIGAVDGNRKNYLDVVKFEHVNGKYREDHAREVSRSKINLNFVRGNAGCSDRVYKILAAQGFLLTEPWKDMEKDFEIGKDLDIFTSPKELQKQIYKYLEDEELRIEIAAHGNNTVQKFSRSNWAINIIKIVKY